MDSKKEKEKEEPKETNPISPDLSKRYCLGCEMGYENQQGHMGGCLPSEEEMWEMDSK
jgi:hypothetical protein